MKASSELLMKCQVCIHGGKDIFPDCVDFDPIMNCPFFHDENCCEKFNCEKFNVKI